MYTNNATELQYSFGIERLHSVYMKRVRMIYIDKALVLYALRR